jgi:hypothetical protein
MGKTLLFLALLFILGLGGLYLVGRYSARPNAGQGPQSPEAVFCTMDAKVCDDGRSVGRDPRNNCEFYPCPIDEDELGRAAPTACTKELKVCADGETSVGRNAERHCAFDACPGEGTVAGSVTLEETCPYATSAPCPTSAYDGELRLEPVPGGKILSVDVYSGAFHVTLATGTYSVSSGRALPRCEGSFTVTENDETTFSVACVAGYR